MLNKNNPNIKDAIINFSDLVKLKDKIDELEEKNRKESDEYDSIVIAFLAAAKRYYNIKNADYHSLLAIYEEEKKYISSLIKSNAKNKDNYLETLFYRNQFCNTPNNYDSDYYDFDEELSPDEIISIKKGN